MNITRIRLCVALLVVTAGFSLNAQQPRVLQPDEYGRWEQLAAQRDAAVAGRRLAGLRHQPIESPERVALPAGRRRQAIVVAYGEQPSFSDDSKWAACLVGMSEEARSQAAEGQEADSEAARARQARGRHHDDDRWRSNRFRSVRRERTSRCGATPKALRDEAADAGETIAPGTPLVVRNLATGQDAAFGSVSEIAWQDKGPALAFAITVDGGVGNGLQLYDTATGVLRTLDSSASHLLGSGWRKESTSLAALRSADGNGREGPTHTLLVWPDVVTPAR